ncbi:hypothetical protein IGI04_027467, partial [Brassica rapa subsp. trilocularis]
WKEEAKQSEAEVQATAAKVFELIDSISKHKEYMDSKISEVKTRVEDVSEIYKASLKKHLGGSLESSIVPQTSASSVPSTIIQKKPDAPPSQNTSVLMETQKRADNGDPTDVKRARSDINHCDAATVDNRILRADIETLRTKVKMAEETVKRVTSEPFALHKNKHGHTIETGNPKVDKPYFLSEQLNRESIQNQFDTNPNIFETLPHWRHKH